MNEKMRRAALGLLGSRRGEEEEEVLFSKKVAIVLFSHREGVINIMPETVSILRVSKDARMILLLKWKEVHTWLQIRRIERTIQNQESFGTYFRQRSST